MRRSYHFQGLLLRGDGVPGSRQLSTRRQLLLGTLATGATVVAGGALAACAQQSGAAQLPPKELPPPETTTVRIVMPPECDPGIWLAKDYLMSEGFTDVRFVSTPFTSRGWLTNDLADVAPGHAEFTVATIDAGLPLTILAGLHRGCFELWVDRSIANVRDLRGRRISVRQRDLSDQFFVFFAALLGYVGIDPLKDVHFVESGPEDYPGMISAYTEGRAEAVLAGGAQGPFLRRLKAPGHVILDTMVEKPWSQYVCCHLVANRDWTRRNPIATQHVTRAVLRATDAAAKDHARAAHDSVAGGYPGVESLVIQSMAMSGGYNWRDLEPEETLRFFGLRLAAAKLIKSTPEQLIQRGTDLAYMRQLRRELKS
jgi:NitT/TauT family transport system substrate-binding protein